MSRGYTCSKGRGLAGTGTTTRDRLDRPRRRRAATSRWDATCSTTSRGAPRTDRRRRRARRGRAVPGDRARVRRRRPGRAGSFVDARRSGAVVLLGRDRRQRAGPRRGRARRGQRDAQPGVGPAAPGLLLLVGTNPVVSHGYGTALPDPVRHLRDYRARGGRIWVVDPRRTETAALADEHLAVRPGSDVAVLAAVAAALLDDGPTRRRARAAPPRTSMRCAPARGPFTGARRGRAPASTRPSDRAAGRRRARAPRAGSRSMCGTGTTMAADGILVEWLRWVLLVLSRLARPARRHALPPRR